MIIHIATSQGSFGISVSSDHDLRCVIYMCVFLTAQWQIIDGIKILKFFYRKQETLYCKEKVQ